MNTIDPLTVIVGIAITINICWFIWRSYFQKCKKCGGKFRKISYKDSMGINLSKRVTISIWKGPRKNIEVWKCETCDHQETKRYWSLS